DPVPAEGEDVAGEVDWERRHALMRTHTALHVLCGVIWHRWGVAVTGGNMEPLAARMDFEFDPLPEGFGPLVEELVNVELAAARPVEVAWVPRDQAFRDQDLIRTKVSLIPEGVDPIRVIDIVGLDKQADGGLHVRSTAEVGRVRVVKTENKGKGFKRVRLEVVDGWGGRQGRFAAGRAAVARPGGGGVQRRGRLRLPGLGRPRHAGCGGRVGRHRGL